MKKNLKRILALVMTLAIAISVSLPAFAAPGLTVGVAPINKTLRSTSNTAAPTEIFQFIVTKVSDDGDVTPGVVAAMPAPLPANLTIDFTGEAWSAAPDADGYYTIKKSIADMFAGINFNHAGIYKYTIKEDPAAATAGMDYSEAEYEVHVYVKETALGVYAIDLVEYQKIKDDKGAAVANVKSDPDFINTWTKNAELTVEKKVTGLYGDKSKDFEFTLTLNPLGTLVNNGDTFTANRYDAAGVLAGTEIFTVGAANNFNLKHGEKIVFEGAGELPQGITYTLSEAAYANYTQQADVTANGVLQTATQGQGTALVIGTAASPVIGLQNPIIISDGANSVLWTNDHPFTAPTGILMNNLPFILVILVAVFGFVGFIVVKRRRSAR